MFNLLKKVMNYPPNFVARTLHQFGNVLTKYRFL